MLSKVTALVADDNPTIRRFIVSALKTHLNCKNVLQAKNGAEALTIINSGEKIDWIFSDWEMPDVSGDEVLLQVRSNRATRHTPFIMITSRNDRDSLITAAQAGVTDYLVKPFSAAALSEKVRKILAGIERRAAQRFLATSDYKVEMHFEKGQQVRGIVENISTSGVLIKMQLNKGKGLFFVYDLATLSLVSESLTVSDVGAELVRIEVDQDSGDDHLIFLAFHFSRLSQETTRKVGGFIEMLPSYLVDKTKDQPTSDSETE